MRSLCEKHNDVMAKLRERLETIEREGENRPAWRLEEKNKAISEAKKASQSLAVELKLKAARQREVGRDVFNEFRKGNLKHTPAPSEKLAWQQQAAATFTGRSMEQNIELYEYQLKRMTPDEKVAWRHVFDDALELAVYGDAAFEFKAAQVIDQHRTPDERSALQAMLKAERLGDFTGTLTAVFEDNFKEAQAGDKQANDPAEVFDTIEADVEAEFTKV